MTEAPEKRKLKNWVTAYQDYTEIVPSPPLFRKWVAIYFLAASMERRFWVRTMGSSLYPNLYILLVGPPGVGKGQAIFMGEEILRKITELKIGPSDMTAASLIDALHEAVRRIIRPGNPPLLQYYSLSVISRELGVLIPGWDAQFMNNLTDIYDGLTVEQKRRGKDLRIKIESPQINLLGACTPSYLNSVLPAGAWDQGFLSRTILVYSGDRQTIDPFAGEAPQMKEFELLLHDLKSIVADYGQMNFTPEAVIAIKAWIAHGQLPTPQHMKLQHYNSRRLAHLLKLCMVASVAESNDKIITLDHYCTALEWLSEAERYMPDIFKSMMSGGDSAAMQEAWEFAWNAFAKEKKAIAEYRLVAFLRDRVPAHGIMRALEMMCKSRMLTAELGKNGQYYRPTSREEQRSVAE